MAINSRSLRRLAALDADIAFAGVLKILTPARNEHLLGAYKLFVSRNFLEALQPQDLPAALGWARTVPRDHGAIDLLSSLADDILAAAWPYLDDEQVRSGVIEVITPRLFEHHELLGPLHDQDDKRTFQEEHGRRLLICDLMEAAIAGEIEPHTLAYSDPLLARPEDYPWIVGKLRGGGRWHCGSRLGDARSLALLPRDVRCRGDVRPCRAECSVR